MKSVYYDTPNAAVALNFKVGSSSLARAVIAAYHPEAEALITSPHGDGHGTAYPAGIGPDDVRWHSLCPKVAASERACVLLAVREPVEHFRSACAESNVDAEQQLTSLETRGWGRDPHFWPQSRLVAGNEVRLYRFPQDLDALALAAGLSLPLPNIAGLHGRTKPTLSSEQEARVRALYAEDVALHASITQAGQVLIPPAPPAPEQVVPSEVPLWAFRQVLIEDGLLEQVLAAVNSDPVLKNFIEYGNFVSRSSQALNTLATALGKDSAMVDTLFLRANALSL